MQYYVLVGFGNKNNHTKDRQFERNYNECKRVGIPIGVYVYNYCISEGAVESGAKWTIEQLQGRKLELPIYIDMEDSSGIGLGQVTNTNICIAFNTIIEQNGYWAGVYANLNWFNNYLNKDIIKSKYTTWIAHYGVSPLKYNGQYDILQYSSNYKVNGINGKVDINEMYRDLINEIKGNETNGGDYIMKEYINGTTIEYVYQDAECTKQIGYLHPREAATCYGIIDNKALIVYKVDGTNNKKSGFVKWLGGIQ